MRARHAIIGRSEAMRGRVGASGPPQKALFDLVGFAFGLMFAVLALTAVNAAARASAAGVSQSDPYEFPDED